MGRGKNEQTQNPVARRPQNNKLEKLLGTSLSAAARREILEDRNIDPYTWLEESGLPIASPRILRKITDGFYHPESGLRTVVHTAFPSSWGDKEAQSNPGYKLGQLHVHGSIYHYDDFVGTFNLYVERDPDGETEVRIGGFSLRPQKAAENNYTLSEDEIRMPDRFIGKGFARAFQQYLENKFKEQGVSRMSLQATGDGRYAWAALGYEYDPRSEPQAANVLEAQREIARKSLADIIASPSFQQYSDVVQSEFMDLQAEGTTSVLDIASVGKEKGKSWPGIKAVGNWHGIKIL